tara:strand:+ start:8576 stop:9673 length:1098 start_codon:yes stop_codon:yes gene_type:complete
MKIAFICPFSYPSKCGVWNTVYNTAKELTKNGHDIHIFSSNIIKGTGKKSSKYEKIEGIRYHRFSPILRITKNAQVWNFEKELINLKPDIIHTHGFRHPHSNKVIKIAKKLKVPCYLTTHAPFLEKGLRNPISQLAVNLFNIFLSKKILNSYTRVFAISKWEVPHLIKLGCNPKKIHDLPNGVSKEFHKIKPKHKKKAIYMGRVAPIKNIETVLSAAKELPEIKFTIYGPVEKNYKIKSELKNVKIINKPYAQKEQILELKNNSIFILPSKREGMPLSLLEAMASGLVCISSDTQGGKELIVNNKTGIIFKAGNQKQLVESILDIVNNKALWTKISKAGKNSTKEKTWDKLTKNLETIYNMDKKK